jgi:hypothetical protein
MKELIKYPDHLMDDLDTVNKQTYKGKLYDGLKKILQSWKQERRQYIKCKSCGRIHKDNCACSCKVIIRC